MKLSRHVIFYLFISMLLTSTANIFADVDGQEDAYTKAANTEKKAAETNKLLSGLWLGVGAVCTTICAASLGGANIASSQLLCTVPSTGVAAFDVVKTKEFTGAIGGILSLGLGVFSYNVGLHQGVDKVMEKSSAQKIAACGTAAVAFIMGYAKNSAMKDAEDAENRNRQLAEQLKSNQKLQYGSAAPVAVTLPSAASIDSGFKGSQSKTNNGFGTGAEDSSREILSHGALCGVKDPSQSTAQVISCIRASDSTFPPLVSDPRFEGLFKKSSGGMDLKDFLNKNYDSPSHAAMAAMASGLSSQQSGKMEALLENTYRQMTGINSDVGLVAGSAPANRQTGGEQKEKIAELNLNKVNEQSFGAKDKNPVNLDQIDFANRTRSPDSIAEDTGLSIFDRITFRYKNVYRRFLSE